MKKIIFFISLTFVISCKKDTTSPTPTPKGNITFWSNATNEWCGTVGNPKIIYVSVDGNSVGQISKYQSVAPSSCVQSNDLLVIQVTQGNHTVSFTQNCNNHTWTDQINLTSDCYVYEVTY
jgi:hypothetical protein